MNWSLARERLGAELIGARDGVTARWRAALREQGHVPSGLTAAASELVLQAGASLADDGAPDAPWRRCGGLLRIDARAQGGGLPIELTELWKAMASTVARIAFSDEEDRAARAVLGQQLEAALRGAAAEVRLALLEEPIDDPTQRFGGPRIISYLSAEPELPAGEIRAA